MKYTVNHESPTLVGGMDAYFDACCLLMDIKEEFGNLIRRLRKEKKLSQEKLAELSDISVNHMSFIETGQKAPTLPVVFALAKALDQSTSSLIKKLEEGLKSE